MVVLAPQVLHRLIAHLDTTSIAEIVVRLVGAEEQTGMYLAPTQARDSHSTARPWAAHRDPRPCD